MSVEMCFADRLTHCVSLSKNAVRKKHQGQVVILTGAGGAIGRQLAKALLADGHILALTSHRPIQDAELLANIATNSDRAHEWSLDLTDAKAAKRFVDEVLERWGQVDVLINMAGLKTFDAFENIPPERFQRVNAVNLNAPQILCYNVVPLMKTQGAGRIINISSRASMVFYGRGTAYCASKAGLIGFSQALADALRGSGITVNVLCPPTIDTEELRRAQPGGNFRRLVRVEQVIAVVRYLMRPGNETTGRIYPFYSIRSYVKAVLVEMVQYARWISHFRFRLW